MVFLAIFISFASVPGCEERAPKTPALPGPGNPKLYLALVGQGGQDPLTPLLATAALEWSGRPGHLAVRCIVPAGGGDAAVAAALDTLDDPMLGGVCVLVREAEPLAASLERLNRRGVRVVSISGNLPPRLRVGHVGMDETAAGAALAQLAADDLAGVPDASIMLLHAGPDAPLLRDRLRGFEERMRSFNHPEVFASIDCAADPRVARREIADRSARFPRLAAWVSLDDWPLHGADGPVVPEGCRLFTVGGWPHQWPLVRSGVVPGFVAGDYHEMVLRALQICDTAVHAPYPEPPHILLPPRVVRADDLEAWIRDWHAWTGGRNATTSPATGPG